jgi:hypothetical protein
MLIRWFMLKVKYKRYEKFLGKRGIESKGYVSEREKNQIEEIRKIVVSVSRNTPWESKCMVRAICCKWLLKRYKISSTIYFGVYQSKENKELKAHAWLKVGQEVITGKSRHQLFKVVNFYS